MKLDFVILQPPILDLHAGSSLACENPGIVTFFSASSVSLIEVKVAPRRAVSPTHLASIF